MAQAGSYVCELHHPAAASHARGVREVQLTDRGGRAHIAGRRGRTRDLDPDEKCVERPASVRWVSP